MFERPPANKVVCNLALSSTPEMFNDIHCNSESSFSPGGSVRLKPSPQATFQPVSDARNVEKLTSDELPKDHRKFEMV